jgi:hypothetical protein
MMLKIKTLMLLTVVISVVSLFAMSGARAEIAPALTAERTCTLENNFGTLYIEAGYNLNGEGLNDEFPRTVACPEVDGECSAWDIRWTWTDVNPAHVTFTVSSDVTLYDTGYKDTTVVSPDANNVLEQRTLIYNRNESTFEATIITSLSSPRIATAGGEGSKFEKYCLIQGPGEVVEEEAPLTRFKYDSIYTLCVQIELDIKQEIVTLAWSCFNPDTEECSETLGGFTPITGVEDVPYEYFGGDFNVITPTTVGISSKDYVLELCPATETASFMDFLEFLGPAEAYAGCSCPPGVKYTSRKKSYCICY